MASRRRGGQARQGRIQGGRRTAALEMKIQQTLASEPGGMARDVGGDSGGDPTRDRTERGPEHGGGRRPNNLARSRTKAARRKVKMAMRRRAQAETARPRLHQDEFRHPPASR